MPKAAKSDKSPTKAPKEKIKSIMDAVSALTSLGDEEGSESGDGNPHETKKQKVEAESDDSKNASKRFIPDHKKPDAALTFPEKLMSMMRFADKHKDDEKYCIAWLPDGKSFVIRNPDSFTRQVLPNYFKATKFQSFTRKLYRWGFRQVNRGIGPDDPIIFGNEFFQRDDEEAMVRMRSVTAAAARKGRGGDEAGGRKRSLEELDEQRKLILLDRLMQEKAAMTGGDPSFMGNMGQYMPPVGFPMMHQRFGGFPPHMMQQQQFMMMQQQAQMQQHQAQMQQQAKQQQDGDISGSSPGKPPAKNASEKDIVNAAINALRYAS